mgnify:CR=1 FL=1
MPKVEIEYCAAWGYESQAVSMTDKILNEFKQDIETYTLIPSDGGRFEITVNGELVFSKLKEKRFPEYDEIHPQIRNFL